MVWLAAASALLLTATGCPDSDTLDNGNFVLTYRTEATGADGYECVLMDIKAIIIRPNDGTCSDTGDPCFNNTDCVPNGECEGGLSAASIPGSGLESVGGSDQGVQWANFTNQGEPCPTFEGQFESGEDFVFQNYNEGLYRITTLNVARPTLVKDNGDTVICDGSSANLARGTYKTVYGDDLFFRLGKDQPNTVRFVIDATKLAPLLEGDCVDNLGSTGYADFLTIQTTQ
jgi:hypothetical protein